MIAAEAGCKLGERRKQTAATVVAAAAAAADESLVSDACLPSAVSSSDLYSFSNSRLSFTSKSPLREYCCCTSGVSFDFLYFVKHDFL